VKQKFQQVTVLFHLPGVSNRKVVGINQKVVPPNSDFEGANGNCMMAIHAVIATIPLVKGVVQHLPAVVH